MLFDYVGMDPYGLYVRNLISADSKELAEEKIRKMGLFVTEINQL